MSTGTDLQRTNQLGSTPTEESVTRSLEPLLPGIEPSGDVPVSVTVQPYNGSDRESWADLIADTGEYSIEAKKGMLAQIRSLLALDKAAKASGQALLQTAQDVAARSEEALHKAWIDIREQNRPLERAVRSIALMFTNMGPAKRFWKNRIQFIDASARELGTEQGREFLDRELAHYAKRPDPRESRAYLVIGGYCGSPTTIKHLGETTYRHRCILLGDAPAYDSLDRLETAARAGGVLGSFSGNRPWQRYSILFGNDIRARRGLQTSHGTENHLYVPPAVPWFGALLGRLANAKPWRPPLGYDSAVEGVDGVKLDLLLEEDHGFQLYLKNRINPMIRLSAGSELVVPWGPDTLCRSGGGVQIGVAAVEMILIRYAEWIVNKYALLTDLEQSEQTVGQILDDFMTANKGRDRMFRSGSEVKVRADEERRCLVVDFDLQFREVAEKAEIHTCKLSLAKEPGQRPGEVTVE